MKRANDWIHKVMVSSLAGSQRWLYTCLAASLGLSSSALAAVYPNPGGDTVVTGSTTATPVYVSTSVTEQVNSYVTTISALLSGSVVFNASFNVPFSDSAVQAAVAAADSLLTRDGANYGAPTLISSMATTTSMTTSPTVPSQSCAQLLNGGYGPFVFTNITQTQTFAPATISVDQCQQDTLTLLPGQLSINYNSELGVNVPVTYTTTVTLLNTQAYQIIGVAGVNVPPAGTSVPEPSTMALVVAGCIVVVGTRRRRSSQSF